VLRQHGFQDLLPNVRQLAFLPHIRDLTIAYVLAQQF
jgi:hypothetical protein